MKRWIGVAMAAGFATAQIASVAAQTVPPAAPAAAPSIEAAPAKRDDTEQESVATDLLTAVPDPTTVAMPDLAFTETVEIAATYPKYYFFHRASTTFQEALGDIRECDGFARGLAMSTNYNATAYSPYGGLAGAMGGAIGSAIAVAIFGSAELRKARRINMRRCMHYKGYQRFGLEKDKWQTFNFEEGLSGVKEVDRQRMLAQQAKVASLAVPAQKDLGL